MARLQLAGVSQDEHAARTVKKWLRATKTKAELSRLWDSLTQYSKTLDGVAVENYQPKELTK